MKIRTLRKSDFQKLRCDSTYLRLWPATLSHRLALSCIATRLALHRSRDNDSVYVLVPQCLAILQMIHLLLCSQAPQDAVYIKTLRHQRDACNKGRPSCGPICICPYAPTRRPSTPNFDPAEKRSSKPKFQRFPQVSCYKRRICRRLQMLSRSRIPNAVC